MNTMLSKIEIGNKGESIAATYLKENGYEILVSNWRYKRAEIDIIASIDKMLVFIEVKTRSSDYFGQPEDSINEKKEALIMDAAQRYMESIGYDWEIRFDIISIIVNKAYELRDLKHYKDAFFY